MKTVLAKLMNNMFVIGKLDSENKRIIESLQIQIVNNPQNPNSFNAMIMPFFAPLTEEKVNIDLDKILTYLEAPDNLKSEYSRITSGVVLATSQDVNNLKNDNVRPIIGVK